MTYPADLNRFGDLFVLDFVRDPSILVERGTAAGITHEYTREISAWCAELNEQLKATAAELGVELQLMGGNAAALRLDAAAQRGSRDNDYLTTATTAEVEALAAALGHKFAALPDKLMQPKRISAEGKLSLPLVAYQVTVPALTVGNRATLEAKLEFHLEHELPPGEDVTGEPFAVGQRLTTRLPALPYQLGLKVITLDDPPIGIPPERIDAVPRQLHDIDSLVQIMTDVDWGAVAPYVRGRYEKGASFHGMSFEPAAPWAGIERRLAKWAECTAHDRLWGLIDSFQSGQVARATRLTRGEWRARVRRLSVILRCLRVPDGQQLYERILVVEAKIDRKLAGRQLRVTRDAFGAVMGDAYAEVRKALRPFPPRVVFWEALAASSDLDAKTVELDAALPRQRE